MSSTVSTTTPAARVVDTRARRAGVLLDRDGTIIVDKGYIGTVERVELIDGAVEAIAALNAAGIPVVVVSNQAGVARGLFDLGDVERVHAHLEAELARGGAHIDLWLFCPYHPAGVVPSFSRPSADRKPGPGMALAAATSLDLDLASSWVVGDSAADVGLARAVGARAILVGGGHTDQPGALCLPDLAAAVRLILADETAPAAAAFPTRRYETADVFAQHYAAEIGQALTTTDLASLDRAAKILAEAYDRDAAVFACGNGGSAAIANHLQCDHLKGVRTGTDLRNRVVSLSSNMELLSAIANDIGYDAVFEYQLESQARPGDVLLAISSSGSSPNIVRALTWAEAHGMQTIAMTGFDGGPARDLATVSIHVPSHNYGVVEDAHQACMHLLAQFVRQSRIAPETIAVTKF